MNMNTNSNFEDMLNEYMNTAEDNIKTLNKRAIKKAGKIKARCNKSGYELDMNKEQ